MESHTIHNTTPFSLSGKVVRSRVVDIYDGDTITIVAESSPRQFHQFKIRLMHIDTPEMRGGKKGPIRT